MRTDLNDRRQPSGLSPHPEEAQSAVSKDEGANKSAKIHDKSGPERILFSENSPARCPASPFRKSSQALSPSTIPMALARPAAASASSSISTKAGHFRQGADLAQGRDRALAKSSSPYYIQTLTALGKFYKFTLDTKWTDLPKVQQALLHGSGDDEINSPMKTACAPTTPRSRSRASSPISTAAIARPKANGRARNSASISPTCLRRLPRLRLKPGAVRQDRRQAHRRI